MDTTALILAIVGCINWGLVGLFKFDLVAWIFGGQTAGFSRVIYTVVALAVQTYMKCSINYELELPNHTQYIFETEFHIKYYYTKSKVI